MSILPAACRTSDSGFSKATQQHSFTQIFFVRSLLAYSHVLLEYANMLEYHPCINILYGSSLRIILDNRDPYS